MKAGALRATLFFCLLNTSLSFAQQKQPLLQLDFEKDSPGANWGKAKPLYAPGHESSRSLLIENHQASSSGTCSIRLPADKIRGQLITVSAVVKGEDISRPPKSWNGVKVMLVLETAGGQDYPQVPIKTGSYPWTKFSKAFRLPPEITGASLVLGLERSTGKVWFDNVRVQLGRTGPTGKRQATRFKGHDLPRLRGVMHGPKFDAEHIRLLAEEWQANHVRWQLNWVPMREAEEWAKDLDAYDKWLDGALAETDKALDAFEKHNMAVLVDLHCPPGGRADAGVCRMFSEIRYRDKLLEVWDKIARRYKDRKCVYAYDLINEPVEPPGGGIISWPELATNAIDVIRAVDPDKPVVVEPGPWGSPNGFDEMIPLERERVIYSFHMYRPHEFTHQGVHNRLVGEGLAYPGKINGVMWDKDRLEQAMIAAIEFQRDFNTHIYVGEFSAIRWAPDDSAYRYIRDCIALFEKHDWDWAYHAYREWSGWSVEHGTDRKNTSPAPQQTKREKLLRDWFSNNQRN